MNKFNLGDRVVVVKQYDCAKVGQKGFIIKTPNDFEYCYGVCFDEPNRYYHSSILGLYRKREYWVSSECLVLETECNCKKNVKCKKCGKTVPVFLAQKSGNGDYYCVECSYIKDYCTKNEEKVHKGTKKRKTYGFELESVKKSEEEYLNMLHEKYHLIPTHDGSLPENGVEFKTPTYRSLLGLKKAFEGFYEWVDFSDYRCGQHINIGDEVYINGYTMEGIRKNADTIFDKLKNYMKQNRVSTERICGRFFTDYASLYADYCDHCCWINLSHQNRIEFRLSKFVTPKQYITLTKMWEEMLDCIINNYVKKYNPVHNTYNQRNANIVANKLVAIFKKYENLTK